VPSLTPAQQEAVDYFDGDSAIIAAAGSGKTFVLVEKIAVLVEKNKIPLEKILCITFTEKAAYELKQRISSRLKLPPTAIEKASIGTIHAFAVTQLRRYGRELGLNVEFKVMDDFLTGIERIRVIRESLLMLAESGDATALEAIEHYGFKLTIRLFVDLISQNKTLSENSSYSSLIKKLWETFDQKKKENNLLDFNDLERLLTKLLHQPSFPEMYQSRFDWIFVDEFQDINPIQWKIISGMHQPKKNRLVIVGDPRQSIYRFRGSDPSLFEKTRPWIEKNGGRVFYLNENFRSTAAVIHFINRANEELFSASYPPLVAVKTDKEGSIEPITLVSPAPMDELRRQEAVKVTEKILILHREGYPWKNITLLFRTRKAIPYYESEFHKNNIPYETSLGEPLLDQPEILSMFYLLKKIINPDGPDKKLIDTALSFSPLSLQETPPFQEPLSDFLKSIFDRALSCFSDKAAKRNLNAFKDLLEQLSALIGKGTGGSHLKTLVETIQALREEEARIACPSPQEDTTEAVRLMTIHGSKGLEFPVVVLCDLQARVSSPPKLYLQDDNGKMILRESDKEAQGLKDQFLKNKNFEDLEKKEKDQDLEESKRLLYVALTRAAERLILPLAPLEPSKTQKKKGQPTWSEWLNTYLQD